MKNFTQLHKNLIEKNRLSKKLLFIILFCPILSFSQWNLIGNPIYGETANDFSGASIALSTDGTTIAIGAPTNDGNGSSSGHVRVFENVSGTWSQIGNDIDGEAAGDNLGGGNLTGVAGAAISLNSDGNFIAVGAPNNDGNGSSSGHVRVFQNVSGVWMQVGQDIDGAAAGEQFGTSVDINSDGTIIAVGAPWYSSSQGAVRVYKLISGLWIQRGADLVGEGAADFFGGSVSLNASGSILAVGARENDGTASGAGHVRVYTYSQGQDRNIQGSWAQLGSDIDGEAQNDRSGCAVSLSSSGNTIAIGAKYNNAGGLGLFSGHVRVYERISSVWTQVGSDIDSSGSEDQFGYSVSLSSDGSRVVVGAHLNDINGSNSGQIRVFDNISSVWTPVYSEVNGSAAGDEFGSSISMSGDGFTIAAGSFWNSTNSAYSGEVRVFQDQSTLSIEVVNLKQNQFSIYPNPTNNYFKIESNEIIDKIEIYSIQGQSIKSFTPQNKYDISELTSGIYFVKIQANNKEITKRIIKE